MTEPIDEAKAMRIAAGHEHFEAEPVIAAVPVDRVNRYLLWGFIGMAFVAIAAVVALATFSIYRGQERQSFNRVITELTDEAKQLRAQTALTNSGINCRASSQLILDAAQAESIRDMAREFASALDRVDPPADPTVLDKAADAVDKALARRAAAIAACAPPAPTTTTPGG